MFRGMCRRIMFCMLVTVAFVSVSVGLVVILRVLAYKEWLHEVSQPVHICVGIIIVCFLFFLNAVFSEFMANLCCTGEEKVSAPPLKRPLLASESPESPEEDV